MARIILKEQGFETKSYPILRGKIGIGRASENTIILRNRYASGRHCEILSDGMECKLIDLGSTNGVFVNGSKVESKKLEDGDKILAGAALMIYVGDEEALKLEDLTGQLQNGAPEERELAASLLGQFGNPEDVGALIQALDTDPESKVKAAAAEALGLLGGSSSIGILLGYFDSEDPLIRNSVVRATIRLADDKTVDGVIDYLKHRDKRVRVLAAYTLGQIKSKRATEDLIKALDDDAFAVREAVVKSLGDLRDSKAAKALIKAATDSKRFPLMWVVDSLGKIRDPISTPLLMKTLKGYDPEVREASAEALGKLRAIEAVPALIEALDDDKPKVCRTVSIALERLRKHVEMTEKMARSTDPGSRTIEIASIGDIGEESSSVTPMFGENRTEWEKWWSKMSDS